MLTTWQSYTGCGVLSMVDSARAFPVTLTLRRMQWHFDVVVGSDLRSLERTPFAPAGVLRLTGTLDDGRPILADRVVLSSRTSENVLLPLDAIEIGGRGEGAIRSATYPLVGMYYGEGSSAVFGDCTFSIEDAHAWSVHTRDESRILGRSLEAKALVLSSLPRTIGAEGCFERLYGIARLLTLASGEGVTAHRQIVEWESGARLEVWRQMKGDELGPGMLVPEHALQHFLRVACPNWIMWPEEKKVLASRALSYLNMSTSGYLDVRLLHVVQVLEALAKAWVPPGTLNDEETGLRQALLDAYRAWRKSGSQTKDTPGFWGSRIDSLFSWPRLRRQLEELLTSHGIGLAAVRLDPDIVRKARDNVAHEGILPQQLGQNPGAALRHLQAAQLSIQLLLLSELGYTGPIWDCRGEWRTVVDTGQFAA